MSQKDVPSGNEASAPDEADQTSVYDWSYFRKGATNILSIPATVLLSAFIGYGGITREAGLDLGPAAFSVPAIWALPSHLIMVAGIASGASILTIIVGTTLASMRMLPMTMALVPEIRTPRSRTWHLLLACTLVALTAWVHTLNVARTLPVRARLPYYVGFVTTLAACATLVTVVTYLIAGTLPPLLGAGLYFLTPLYFSVSIWATCRRRVEYLAAIIGFFSAPVIAMVWPSLTVLIAGVGGGLLAYLFHRFSGRKRALP